MVLIFDLNYVFLTLLENVESHLKNPRNFCQHADTPPEIFKMPQPCTVTMYEQ